MHVSLRAVHVPRPFQSLREANLPAEVNGYLRAEQDQGPCVGFQPVLESVVPSLPSPAAAQGTELPAAAATTVSPRWGMAFCHQHCHQPPLHFSCTYCIPGTLFAWISSAEL